MNKTTEQIYDNFLNGFITEREAINQTIDGYIRRNPGCSLEAIEKELTNYNKELVQYELNK